MNSVVADVVEQGFHGTETPKIKSRDKYSRKVAVTSPLEKTAWSSKLFYLLLFAALFAGWFYNEDSNLSAEDGMGYYLGIIGGSAMLLLMLYPVRKKMRLMRNWGAVKYWFQMHMLLGIWGPVLILFHANFNVGSTNSQFALFSMLLVAGSGLFGKYFYRRIHFGLYGRKATLKELRSELKITKGNLGEEVNLSKKVVKKLQRYETFSLKNRGVILGFLFLPLTSLRAFWVFRSARRLIKKELRKQAKSGHWGNEMLKQFYAKIDEPLFGYVYYVKKVAEFSVYEGLFSLWHILHYPLFLMMVISGIIHVLAVHMY